MAYPASVLIWVTDHLAVGHAPMSYDDLNDLKTQGIGRTGTVLNAYLLRRGLGHKLAGKILKKLRSKPSNFCQWRTVRRYGKQAGRLTVRRPYQHQDQCRTYDMGEVGKTALWRDRLHPALNRLSMEIFLALSAAFATGDPPLFPLPDVVSGRYVQAFFHHLRIEHLNFAIIKNQKKRN